MSWTRRFAPDYIADGESCHAGSQINLKRLKSRPPPKVFRETGHVVVVDYRTSSPVMALPMIMRWISEVPSKMVKIFASRCQRSTGKSRV